MKELKYLSIWVLGFFTLILALTTYSKNVEDVSIWMYFVFIISWTGSCYFSYYSNKF